MGARAPSSGWTALVLHPTEYASSSLSLERGRSRLHAPRRTLRSRSLVRRRWPIRVTGGGQAPKQYHIGLEETDDGLWSTYFATVLLAKVDERDMIIRD